MLSIVEKAKISQTLSQEIKGIFLCASEHLKLDCRVFYIIVLANAKEDNAVFIFQAHGREGKAFRNGEIGSFKKIQGLYQH